MINSSNAIPTYGELLQLIPVSHINSSTLTNSLVFNSDGYVSINLSNSKVNSTVQGYMYLRMNRNSNVQMVSTPIYFDTASPNTVIISRCWLPDTPTMVECDVQVRMYRQLQGELKICEPDSDEPLYSITAWNGKLSLTGYVLGHYDI